MEDVLEVAKSQRASFFYNAALYLREIFGWRNRDFARSYASLHSLLQAGIPIRQALEMNDFSGVLSAEEKNRLVSGIGSGNTLAEELGRIQGMPSVDRACLSAGEKSGHLPQVLQHLSRFHEQWAKIRTHSWNQMLYPIFLLHVAAILLEVSTLVSGTAGSFLGAVARNLLGFYIGGILLALFLSYVGKSPLAGAFYSLPVVGRFRRDFEIARFAMAFRHLYEAGVEIVESYRMACSSLGSPYFRDQLLRGLAPLQRGEPLLAALKETGVLQRVELQILDTGEKTGTLAESWDRVDHMLRERGEYGLKRFAFWLTQLVHLGVLLWVALRVIGFYQGYYSQLDAIMK